MENSNSHEAKTALGSQTPAAAPKAVGNRALQETIRDIVLSHHSPFDKRRIIRDLVKQVLLDGARGFVCQTPDGRGFYFHRAERRLYDLEQKPFQYLLSSVSGLSATEAWFRFVLDSLQTEAARREPVEVHTLSFYEVEAGCLVISDGQGGVWRRERGGRWEQAHNGDGGILFLTDSDAEAWTPEFRQDGSLAWLFSQLLLENSPELSRDEQRTLLLVWLLENLFPALRRTRIIPAFLGPQGSGKSSAMRMIGRVLCGPQFDVTGLSRDREDGFVASLCNRVLVGVDNADSRIPWLEDGLATYATGQRYRLRRLYTTNEEVSYSPRAVLMLSSRDPHFRRPDVSERLLPFSLERPQKYESEEVLYSRLMARRGRIMGELLLRAATIADLLASVKLPSLPFRMADFASFGWVVARVSGQEAEWQKLLSKLEQAQAQFASEGDTLVMVLRSILETESVIGPVDTGQLYKRCAALAESESLPFPRSAPGFGRHLTNMKRVIEVELGATFYEERGTGNRRYVTIRPR